MKSDTLRASHQKKDTLRAWRANSEICRAFYCLKF